METRVALETVVTAFRAGNLRVVGGDDETTRFLRALADAEALLATGKTIPCPPMVHDEGAEGGFNV